jgi:predicted phosphate transport protein (TIGR00153 family)
MKIDNFIRKLMPRDDKFYQLLEESAKNLIAVGDVLQKITSNMNMEELEPIVEEIKDLEHEGDSITHKIFHELNITFVTPFDREDIHYLASALDDVLDYINSSTGRFTLYRVDHIPGNMIALIDVICKSIIELAKGVKLLRDLHDLDSITEVLRRVNDYEDQADQIFDRAIADLFNKVTDPIRLIKLKEIYVSLETATDKCEDAANVLESILIKNA